MKMRKNSAETNYFHKGVKSMYAISVLAFAAASAVNAQSPKASDKLPEFYLTQAVVQQERFVSFARNASNQTLLEERWVLDLVKKHAATEVERQAAGAFVASIDRVIAERSEVIEVRDVVTG